MDILIKGIGNLSKECNECLRTYIAMNDGGENLIGSLRVDCKAGSVDCPLVALPEHGALKDYDSLGNTMANKMVRRKCTWHPFYYEGFKEALKMLDSAPTIVEASE